MMVKRIKVSFVGLGVMGYHMAGHLCKSNKFELQVYNRTSEKSLAWEKEFGGNVVHSLEEAASQADVVIICSGRDEDMEEIVYSDGGIYKCLNKGAIVIDHTTTSFKLAKKLSKSFKEINIEFVDAPVSGGEAGAINGVLSVMAGGDRKVLNSVKHIIEEYSKSINYMGGAGYGQLAKMVNQICIAGVLQGLSEGILFAESEGVDMESLLSAVSGGAAQSWQMVNRADTMHNREFDFGFAIKWMVKDLGYCLERAEDNKTKLPIAKEVYDRYVYLMNKGHERSDTSALMLYDELSNT
ncbi:MAG: NAD(P)-dependent oxidoreductase [Gammaproteobacteria bacterium]|jgi:3-hydroxyisobutyrate dehydrogenase-like beta-hydroxyacid dehydrogenase|nr:NAD(P)-dependent oxidoreductase [Gammaproteobacteria bacterium]|tara:strand:- start:30525 stop:31415 length:891 start_codon:yes stop_codon:yes gene_type:complete